MQQPARGRRLFSVTSPTDDVLMDLCAVQSIYKLIANFGTIIIHVFFFVSAHQNVRTVAWIANIALDFCAIESYCSIWDDTIVSVCNATRYQ